MLYGELSDCTQCPFIAAGMCSGDVSMGPNGPIYPPCEGWDDDVDVDAELAARIADVEARVAAGRAADVAKAKRTLANRRRRFVDKVCITERLHVKAAEKHLAAAKRLASRAAVLASVDAFFGGATAPTPPDAQLAAAVAEAEQRLANAKAELKEARAAARRLPAYAEIT